MNIWIRPKEITQVINTKVGTPIYLFSKKHLITLFSKTKKLLQLRMTKETPNNIQEKSFKLNAKDFILSKFYSDKNIFLPLNRGDQPIFIPSSTWHKSNMQIISSASYSKGLLL